MNTCRRVFVTDRRYTEARLRVARQHIMTGTFLLAGQVVEALASDNAGD